MWPISDFLMKVWTAQIRPRPLSYVVLNQIHIPCFAMRLQPERTCESAIFTSLKCARRHNSALEEAGRLKSQYIDNTVTSLFRLRLHINLSTLTRAASIYISVWRHVFFCACGSLQGRIRFTHETDAVDLNHNVNNSAKNPIRALRPAVWTKS